MTRYHLRFEGGASSVRKGDVLLDWAPRQNSATIDTTKNFLPEWKLALRERLLLAFGSAIYCADKLNLRREANDGWTRDFSLAVSGNGVESMEGVGGSLEGLLGFLTGDRWALRFQPSKKQVVSLKPEVPSDFDAVCLFSGGLDSLCGAIEILEHGNSVCLVSHHEGGIIAGRQTRLVERLASHYGPDRVHHEQVWIGPAGAHPEQSVPLGSDDREETTRSRSFLFISVGVALASTLGDGIPLFVPENGFIGINVPLMGSRLGSLSTRTTHPYFMAEIASILAELGFQTPIVNDFRLKTKGEVIASSSNLSLLSELVSDSLSCAHPQAARWAELPQGNCGYCFPCLIRRASMFTAGWDDASGYAFDVLNDPALLETSSDRSADFRALLFGLSRPPSTLAVLRNGAVPLGEAVHFDDVYARGRKEIRQWLIDGASKTIRKNWPRVFNADAR